jgi:hypothetical protein
MTIDRTGPVLLLFFAWSTLCALPASAQTVSGPDAETLDPWERDVPTGKQQAAELLFREANSLLMEGRFSAAEGKYREALEVWDHPAIHYNFAQLLFRQGNLLATHDHLTKAMSYGKGAIGAERFSRAQSLKTSVEKQLGQVVITCEVRRVSVWLDDRHLLDCPGQAETFVLPGVHTISARQEGYPHNDRPRTLAGGQVAPVHIGKLYGAEELHVATTRWATWKPWALVGAGVAIAGGGGLLHLQARNLYQRFDDGVGQCGDTGCAPTSALTRTARRGDRFQHFALGSYTVGGVAAVTGTILVIFNKDQFLTRTPDQLDGMNLSFTTGRGEHAVLATWRF